MDKVREIDRLVGRRVRLARVKQGISQSELGRRVGITRRQMRGHEYGLQRVDVFQLFQMVRALGVELSSLFQGRVVAPTRVEAVELALLYQLDIVALHNLSRLRNPAAKREIVRIIAALVDSDNTTDT